MSNVISVAIIADTKRLQSGLSKSTGLLSKFGRSSVSAGSVLKGALLGGAVFKGLSLLTQGFTDAAAAIQLQDQLAAQTSAVLKSTGGAAGVTASQVNSLSSSIEKKSMLDAEAIQSGQNLLLTFTNIKNEAGKGNDIFNQTTQAMADMSTAMGSDPKTAALQLGKALNDPVKGITALSRVGVSFSDKQKAVIKRLQETGDTAGAQKVILKELSKEFGGSAKAAGDTAAGQFKHFKDMLDDAFETILRKAIPVLLKIITYLTNNLPKALQAAQPYVDKLKSAFETVFNFLKDNQPTLKAFAIVLGITAVAVGITSIAMGILNAVLLANPITLIIIGLLALAAGLIFAYNHVEGFRKIVDKAWAFIKTSTAAVFPVIKQIILIAFKVISTYVKVYIKVITTVLKVAWAVIKVVTKVAWAFIKNFVIEPIKAIVNFVKVAGPAVKNAITTAWNAVKNATKTAWNAVKNAVVNGVTSVINKVKEIKGKVTGALSDAGTLLLDAGKAIIQGLIDGIAAMFGKLKDKLGEVGKFIKDHKGPPAKDLLLLRKSGKLIMQGLIDGFTDGTPGVEKSLEDLTNFIDKTLTKKLSKKFKGDKLAEVLAKRTKEVIAAVSKQIKAIKQQGKAIDAGTEAIKNQQEALAGLQQQAVDYATTIKDAFNDFANITSLDTAFTADAIIKAMQTKLVQAQHFADVIKQLIALGLNQTTLQQILSAGVEGGTAIAEALAAGGSSAVGSVNDLQTQIQAAGQGLGNAAADTMYGAGIQAAQGLLNGLLANQKELKKVAKALGQALVDAIKKELGIKSPSKVFKLIGEFTVAGLAQGLSDTTAVERAASRMGNAVLNGYGAPTVGGSGERGGNGDTINLTVNMPIGVTSVEAERQIAKGLDSYYAKRGKRVALASA